MGVPHDAFIEAERKRREAEAASSMLDKYHPTKPVDPEVIDAFVAWTCDMAFDLTEEYAYAQSPEFWKAQLRHAATAFKALNH